MPKVGMYKFLAQRNKGGDQPLVVCRRSFSFITANLVPNSRFNSVPVKTTISCHLSSIALHPRNSLFPVDWEPKTATTS